MKYIYYLQPSSFCFWVNRAIKMLQDVIHKHPKDNILCVHELVHNPIVNNTFTKQWIQFIDNLDESNNKEDIIVFSAHWVNRKTILDAKKKHNFVYNLECPLVTKIYTEIDNYLKQKITTFFYIWKQGHQEAQNVMDYITYKNAKLFHFLEREQIPDIEKSTTIWVLSQTTLNSDKITKLIIEIKKKYKQTKTPAISDICKATHDRQQVINKHKTKFSALIVIWWKNSSNTKELVKIWEKHNKKVFFWTETNEILTQENEILKHNHIAITWWASTPQEWIKEIFNILSKKWYKKQILWIENT